MTAALEGGEWSAARPGRTLPPGKTRYPLYRRLGGSQGPVWTGGKYRPHRDSIPDRRARSSVSIPTELPGPQLCACSLIYPACKVHALCYIVTSGLSAVLYLSILSHKMHDLRRKLLNMKSVFWFSTLLFMKYFSF